MGKDYKKIEYIGDMSKKEIVKEVFKQLYERYSAIDLFEKMEDLEIKEDIISYGVFDLAYTIEYDGMQEDLDKEETIDRKGKSKFYIPINGAIYSNGTKVIDNDVINIIVKIDVLNFDKSEKYDVVARRIVNAQDSDELMEKVKLNAELWADIALGFFDGDIQFGRDYKVSDGTIKEVNVILINYKYNGIEFKNVCVLSGYDCIIKIDYPKEQGQKSKLIKNTKYMAFEDESYSNLNEIYNCYQEWEDEINEKKREIDKYNKMLKDVENEITSAGILAAITNSTNFKVLKNRKNYLASEIESKKSLLKITEDSYASLKNDLEKIENEFLSRYKKTSYEKVLSQIDNVTIDGFVPIKKNSPIEHELSELNNLIGLTKVKQDVKSMVDLITVNNKRKEMSLPVTQMSYHLVFSGNPGTGKTTVARILAKIYRALGIIQNEKVVEVDRSELVAGYVGQTAIKTQEVIDSAKGGILFIDEAYTLARGNNADDFGQEAIDTILKEMEDNRDNLVVIVAGYTDLMKKFISSNPGLESRFNKYIEFDDYTPNELYDILELNCKNKGYILDEGAKKYAKEFFVNRYNNRDENYANARDVRNFFEKAVINQSSRIVNQGIDSMSKDDMIKITIDDLKTIKLK